MPRATKYYSVLQSTSLDYKVVLRYYSVLPSATKYYSVPKNPTWNIIDVARCKLVWLSNLTKHCACHENWFSWLIQFTDEISIIQWRSNRCYLPTSLNTVRATKNDSYDWSLSRMKGHFQCAKQQALPSTITKYCGCHEKSFHIPLRISTLIWGWLASKDDFFRHHIFPLRG